jgi:hypothetical protein
MERLKHLYNSHLPGFRLPRRLTYDAECLLRGVIHQGLKGERYILVRPPKESLPGDPITLEMMQERASSEVRKS